MKRLARLWAQRDKFLRGAAFVAVCIATAQYTFPSYAYHSSEMRTTGLASVRDEDKMSLWESSNIAYSRGNSSASGQLGGVPGGIAASRIGAIQPMLASMSALPSPPPPDTARRVAQSVSFDLTVLKPDEAAEKARLLAERLGGYIETSARGADSPFASLSIRIPVARLEEAKIEIRKLAVRIETEQTQAEDVTKQYVDTEARLRNLRAQEAQYLELLKHAASVSDTLEVSEKLDSVRSAIEELQAEFAALSKRVETVAVVLTLRAQSDVKVLGLDWRPLFRAKLAVRGAIESLGEYCATMFAIIVRIPVIALWLITLVALASVAWRLFRWTARAFFGWFKPAVKPV